jgi:NAD(P)-dependent dehydrogenase (short-subunit alcohol dehydrogenase family)
MNSTSMNSITFDFTGSTVLVTGGTSGIGHGIATAFRDAGAQVTVTGTRSAASEYDVELTGLAYLQLARPSMRSGHRSTAWTSWSTTQALRSRAALMSTTPPDSRSRCART